ncbi:MaoC family dehydratase [Roseivirga echinicomitans]|uniref:Dehydrogenase n=1 Tax=Roseivirga echinicomitans TaxID=296218 RepID=A0A150XVW3_9BACT|nr:MaoC family dehydratase [Roseivirga echinicomitans]KYG82853.1 dehydrogenase [Roseivirga echinicomitans]
MENKVTVNTVFEYGFSFNQTDVENFAKASGDFNPIHLDAEYAKDTIFGRTIIHGFLSGSMFSKVFGTIFPGHGTIYLNQSLNFFKPMYTAEEYMAVFTVKEVYIEKRRALITTEIFDSHKQVTISGEALIQHNDIV